MKFSAFSAAPKSSKLEFQETWTMQEFKQRFRLSRVDVLRKKDDGRHWFKTDAPEIKGSVSGTPWSDGLEPVVSRCKGENGEFYLMHRGETEAIASF